MNSEKQSTNLQMILREVNRVGEVKKNIPKLRFKGYEDAWEQRKLGQVLDFSLKTNSLSRSMLNYEEGELKNIHYGDILMDYCPILNFKTDTIPYITEGKVEEFTSQLLMNGDVVFADAAEDESVGKAIEINGLEEQCLVSGLHTIVGRPTIKFAERFLGYYINSNSYHNQLLPLMQGTKVSSISKTTLQKTMIIYPKVNSEQLKIGSFFYCLESIITLHQRKYDALKSMKKTLLSKMFPKNGEDVPEIRFKGFTNAWEQRKLGDIADKVTVKNSNLQYIETFTNSAEVGIISQRDYFDHDIANLSNLDGYYIVQKEDFVYNPRISTSAPVGPINRNKLGRVGVMSPLYTVFRTHNVDTTYLEYYFKSQYWHSFMKFHGDSGARADRFSIKDAIFFEMPIPLPDIDEQQKIGDYLNSVDYLITLHQRNLEELKKMKKTLLQQMFV